MYITICEIDDQCKFDPWAGHSKPVLWDSTEGWSREGKWEWGSGWGDTGAPMCDSCQCMAKTTTTLSRNYPPIKINKWNLKKRICLQCRRPGLDPWVGKIPGLGRSPGEGNGNPLQYFYLENPTDRGAWRATVLGVTEGQAWLKQLGMHACTHTCVHTYRERESWKTLLYAWD